MAGDDVWEGLHLPTGNESKAENPLSPFAALFPVLPGEALIATENPAGSSTIPLTLSLQMLIARPPDYKGDLEFATLPQVPDFSRGANEERRPQSNILSPGEIAVPVSSASPSLSKGFSSTSENKPTPISAQFPDRPKEGRPDLPPDSPSGGAGGASSDSFELDPDLPPYRPPGGPGGSSSSSSDLDPDSPSDPESGAQIRFPNGEAYRNYFKPLLRFELEVIRNKRDKRIHQALILMVLSVASTKGFAIGDKLYLVIEDKANLVSSSSFCGFVCNIDRKRNELIVDRRGLEKLAVFSKRIKISTGKKSTVHPARIETPKYRSEIVVQVCSVEGFSCGDILFLHSGYGDEPFTGTICEIDEEESSITVNVKELERPVEYVSFAAPYVVNKMLTALRHFDNQHPFYLTLLGFTQDLRTEKLTSSYTQETLNPAQNSAVTIAVINDFTLIQGPPGTGKTKVASSIACEFAKKDSESAQTSSYQKGIVLVCASSNIATDNLATSIYELHSGLRVVRLYSHEKEKTVRPALAPLAFHYLFRDQLVSDLPDLASQLYNLDSPERKLMADLFARYLDHFSEDDFIERPNSERFDAETEKFLHTFDIVCCTCVSSATRLLSEVNFKYVIIDEAAFSPEPETLLALKKTCRKVVLIGDQNQLPPVVLSLRASNNGYSRSLFERLIECGKRPKLLNRQYRMVPELSKFPREAFYNGNLLNAENVEQVQVPPEIEQFFAGSAKRLINVEGPESRSESSSYFNEEEVKIVLNTLQDLYKSGISGSSIGVISAYNTQRELIVEAMRGLPDQGWVTEVDVRNLDGYQGREKDVIVISTARSNTNGKIGFLSEKRRINVATTRGRFGLILIGNLQLLRSNEIWRRFIDEGSRSHHP